MAKKTVSSPVVANPTEPPAPKEALVPKVLEGAHINAYKEEARQAIGAVQAELTNAVQALDKLLERIVPGTPHDPES